jgi:hypothetical protein
MSVSSFSIFNTIFKEKSLLAYEQFFWPIHNDFGNIKRQLKESLQHFFPDFIA